MSDLNWTVDQLIRDAGNLPPMPQAVQKALAMIRNPDSSAADVAGVLAVDQVLTALVLQMANSTYYGLESKVATVQQAVAVLGMNMIMEVILASSVAAYLYRPVPGYALKRGELWRHSVGVAMGAQCIAEEHHWKAPEVAYHAGLLCDIGKVAFEKLLRDTDTLLPEWQDVSFMEAEKDHFGIDHAHLGAEIGRRWNLPEEIIQVITYHHIPEQAADHSDLVAAVHVADATVMMLGVGVGKDGLRYPLNRAALERLNFRESDLSGLFEQIMLRIHQAEALIGFNWDRTYVMGE